MMKNNFGWLGCGVATALTVVQTNEIFQIISLILTCIATLLTIAYNIYRWYKKATQDGKIDLDEIDELINILQNDKKGIDEKIEELSKMKDKGENK